MCAKVGLSFFDNLGCMALTQVKTSNYLTSSNILANICILFAVPHCDPQVRSYYFLLLLLVGMSWILLYKSIVEAKYCDRFTRWLSSFISHQIQCNMPTRGMPKNYKGGGTSRLEAHAGFFRMLMKGIFDPYVL